MDPKHCVLFSGAANGAEAAFGAAAERHGVEEVNFTFDGHPDARSRGIRVLTHTELEQGDVSLEYIGRLMNRTFKNTRLFRAVLQTIWHQVNSAQEVYVVGRILEDQTVKGGTGWGAEFAKICNKPLYVFDQNKNGWFTWEGVEFEPTTDPVVTHTLFCGGGTRSLTSEGRAAIDALFDRTFG